MHTYLWIIQQAILFFPLLAFFITIPYMLYNYHKYGSIIAIRTLLIYSFVLYLLCAFFLVILPLPEKSKVAMMTSRRTQLIPFTFIKDIIKEAKHLHGISIILHNKAIYQFLFNILMLIPFGMFLHYYFACNLKRTILFSFLLSLFFEITQLTGIFFIYPRGYRLFDVDDLLANTLGGFLGYACVIPLKNVLPSKNTMDEMSFTKGKKITLSKWMTSVILDSFCCIFITGFTSIVLSIIHVEIHVILIYFVIYALWNCIRNGETFGKKFTHMQIVDASSKDATWYQFLIRYGALYLYFYIPDVLRFLFQDSLFLRVVCIFLLFAWFIVSLFRISMQKPLLYERISHTKIISTIQKNDR